MTIHRPLITTINQTKEDLKWSKKIDNFGKAV